MALQHDLLIYGKKRATRGSDGNGFLVRDLDDFGRGIVRVDELPEIHTGRYKISGPFRRHDFDTAEEGAFKIIGYEWLVRKRDGSFKPSLSIFHPSDTASYIIKEMNVPLTQEDSLDHAFGRAARILNAMERGYKIGFEVEGIEEPSQDLTNLSAPDGDEGFSPSPFR